MKLVIVESPTKSKTIGKYLGPDYKVIACKGHIRDLDTRGPGGLGVDIAHGFQPNYKIQKDKIAVVNELKEAMKKADEVILATDPDREGEAIAWHLADVLNLPVATTTRWQFHEITQRAIKAAQAAPAHIDMNLVHSQECRRIIDRIVGFRLSALLQKKIKSRSAGRVQSVALRFIVDHEKEIKAFVPEDYWIITGSFGDPAFKCQLVAYNGKPLKIKSQQQADDIIKALPKIFDVSDVSITERTREPKPAFTTSTLQQESFTAFRYSTKKTQLIAQHLYEGKEIEGSPVGLVTYIRTDANRLAPEFAQACISHIERWYGAAYAGHTHVTTKKSDTVQDAHEAIRPTDLAMTPERVRPYLSKDEYNVYRLIYERAVASLMAPRREAALSLKLTGNGYTFRVESVKMLFDGYSKVYGEFESYPKPTNIPELKQGDKIALNGVEQEKKTTTPPARYTEARMVHLMEEKGIGRPSTYASTISTLEDRDYVVSQKGILAPTEQGDLTVEQLTAFFPELMDASYTANMESELDDIADGKSEVKTTLDKFYSDFIARYQTAEKTMDKVPDRPAGRDCPECGRPLVYRKGKFGEFVACSGFPKCHFVEKSAPDIVEGKVCPECGSALVRRRSRRGTEFIGCSNYPNCTYIDGRQNSRARKPIEIPEDAPTCPRCGKGKLVEKTGRFGPFVACSAYPECRYILKTPRKTRAKKAKAEE